jgi:hypothetical protein
MLLLLIQLSWTGRPSASAGPKGVEVTEGRRCEEWVGAYKLAADPAWWTGRPRGGSLRDLRRAEEQRSEEDDR